MNVERRQASMLTRDKNHKHQTLIMTIFIEYVFYTMSTKTKPVFSIILFRTDEIFTQLEELIPEPIL